MILPPPCFVLWIVIIDYDECFTPRAKLLPAVSLLSDLNVWILLHAFSLSLKPSDLQLYWTSKDFLWLDNILVSVALFHSRHATAGKAEV